MLQQCYAINAGLVFPLGGKNIQSKTLWNHFFPLANSQDRFKSLFVNLSLQNTWSAASKFSVAIKPPFVTLVLMYWKLKYLWSVLSADRPTCSKHRVDALTTEAVNQELRNCGGIEVGAGSRGEQKPFQCSRFLYSSADHVTVFLLVSGWILYPTLF